MKRKQKDIALLPVEKQKLAALITGYGPIHIYAADGVVTVGIDHGGSNLEIFRGNADNGSVIDCTIYPVGILDEIHQFDGVVPDTRRRKDRRKA